MANWIWITQWGARGVLVLLFLLSIWSLAIIFERARAYRSLRKSDELAHAKAMIVARDWLALREWAGRQGSVHAGVIQAAIDASSSDRFEPVDRSVKSYLLEKRMGLEKGLTVLATLGSNAPFIGLFGTVLGIIQAFGVLASTQAGTASIMNGIAEALVATAFGLFVAIPAVVAYNVFSRKLKNILVECEALRDLYLSKFQYQEI